MVSGRITARTLIAVGRRKSARSAPSIFSAIFVCELPLAVRPKHGFDSVGREGPQLQPWSRYLKVRPSIPLPRGLDAHNMVVSGKSRVRPSRAHIRTFEQSGARND